MASSLLAQLKDLPPLPAPASGKGRTAADCEVSLLIPARHAGHALEVTVLEAHRHLASRFKSFEMILIPNSPQAARAADTTLAIAQALSARLPNVVVQPHDEPVGKGAALRSGYLRARGQWIFFTDADLPYDLGFFDGAARKLRAGYDLVTGNRRVDESLFDVPVSLLPLAYGRHRLGLLFNRVVRACLPIRTTDTQAGIKAMSRRLADLAFATQRCPGFFFDLELWLAARGGSLRAKELPVTLYLNSEKSTVRILRETVLAAYWLARIAWRNIRGQYGRPPRTPSIPGRYARAPGLTAKTRLFLRARWALTPYARIAAQLPDEGLILDLGCGHGLLALAAALETPSRSVLGFDHDEERVRLARFASQGIANLRFESETLGTMEAALGQASYAAVTMIDVLHYFDSATQRKLLEAAFRALLPGGRLLVREVDPEGGWISAWNRLYEKLATASGFTRTQRHGLRFRTRDEWIAQLSSAGFRVRAERCSSPLFADVLFTCEKPGHLPGANS